MDLTDPGGPLRGALLAGDLRARQAARWPQTGRSRCTSARPSRIRERVRETLANLRQVFRRRDAVLRAHPDLRLDLGLRLRLRHARSARHAPPSRSTRRHRGARHRRPAVLQRRHASRSIRASELHSRHWSLGRSSEGGDAQEAAQVLGRVTLVLIGVAALAGCERGRQRRDVYASTRGLPRRLGQQARGLHARHRDIARAPRLLLRALLRLLARYSGFGSWTARPTRARTRSAPRTRAVPPRASAAAASAPRAVSSGG